MNLSDQALGAIMMCLQKGLITQTDITGHLRKLEFYTGENDTLYIENPPTFKIPENSSTMEPEDLETGGSD